MRQCIGCGKIIRKTKNGTCTKCGKRTWAVNNADKMNSYKQKYVSNNKDKVKKSKLVWEQNNKEKAKLIRQTYKRSSLKYRLINRLRIRLVQALRKNFKSGFLVFTIGCTVPELKVYLEKQFQPGMTWENWGYRGWHIDHIMPLASFNLSDPEEVKRAMHYSNLQPLWAKDNFKKSDKIGGGLSTTKS